MAGTFANPPLQSIPGETLMGGLLSLVALSLLSPDRMGGYRAGSDYNRLYHRQDVVGVSVIVSAIGNSIPTTGMEPIGTLTVQSVAGGMATVELAPEWYLAHKNLDIKLGDRLVVYGSRSHEIDSDVIMAQRIRKGDHTYLFRAPGGRPLWDIVRTRLPQPLGELLLHEATAAIDESDGEVVAHVRMSGTDATFDVGPAWLVERQTVALSSGPVQAAISIRNGVPAVQAIVWPGEGPVVCADGLQLQDEVD